MVGTQKYSDAQVLYILRAKLAEVKVKRIVEGANHLYHKHGYGKPDVNPAGVSYVWGTYLKDAK